MNPKKKVKQNPKESITPVTIKPFDDKQPENNFDSPWIYGNMTKDNEGNFKYMHDYKNDIYDRDDVDLNALWDDEETSNVAIY